MLRISLICLALGACVKPATTSIAPHSSYDLYNLCGDAKADPAFRAENGGCASSVEHAPLVDTNLSAPPQGVLVAFS
ncbi:hypothetical protein BH11MYX1_BH11MYX1_00040 [soil metagenome]